MPESPYTKRGRLADVLALIQVLALDPDSTRRETGITRDLQGSPISAESWFVLAAEHRELFRVNPQSEYGLSLVARYVLPHGNGQKRAPISSDFVSALLQTAISLHDRQVSKAEWWKTLVPLWAALIGGAFATASTLLTIYFKGAVR